LIQLAKVYLEEDMMGTDWKFKENPDAKQALIEASMKQIQVIDLCKELSHDDRIDGERKIAADISYKLGKYYVERDGNNEDALACFHDCLQRQEDHAEAMIEIARINQSLGQNDECTQMCKRVLKLDPRNEDATYMLANLMLMKEQGEGTVSPTEGSQGAIKTYIDLLEKEPDNFNILANLIELLKRAGKITDCQKYIENAEAKTQRSKMAGLAYCKGLYSRYNSEPQKALRELNFARYDNFYGESAITNMIEIYLNPANDMIFSSQLEIDYGTTVENIQAARELMEELKGKGVDTSIIECQILISTKQKSSLEEAQKLLKQILAKNSQYVPANVCMGLCLFMLKKSADARNYLKTVIKNKYQLQYADFFEQAWILMADYYISVNKYDLAEAELKNCLKYNKSMIKAEELMGLIKEKEKAYVDAADHYAVAWKMSNKKNGGVGFRLAFNYLKADRYVDAIDVGKDILKVYPSFPKVQTEIIDKARGMIRC
jgi:tetratricopeptide repeat protein 21B